MDRTRAGQAELLRMPFTMRELTERVRQALGEGGPVSNLQGLVLYRPRQPPF